MKSHAKSPGLLAADKHNTCPKFERLERFVRIGCFEAEVDDLKKNC